MKYSRGYWTGMMMAALLISGASGWYVLNALKAQQIVKVSPKIPKMDRKSPPTAPPVGKQIKRKKEETPRGENASAPLAGKRWAQKTDNGLSLSKRHNILFSYHNASAKNVAIIGDFNKWFRAPLLKKGPKTWQVAIKIAPGQYEYQFVVDGQKIRDPNNKKKSPKGRSILTVKPFSTK